MGHTDEDFTNADLGNCLDYSHNPSESLHPGLMNFEKLQVIYGSSSNRGSGERARNTLRKQRRRTQEQPSTETVTKLLESAENDDGVENNYTAVTWYEHNKLFQIEYDKAFKDFHNIFIHSGPLPKELYQLGTGGNGYIGGGDIGGDDGGGSALSWHLLEHHPRGSRYQKFVKIPIGRKNYRSYKLELQFLHA